MIGAWVVPSLVGPRHARAAGTLPAPDAARRDHLVPAVQRAGGRAPTWPGCAPARNASRAAGRSPARRSGPRSPGRRSGGSASPVPTRTRRSTAGITYFLVDMATPGIEVRPLQELTGDSIFNEVFLDEVFVPDAMVVGTVNAGWQVARRTLTAERVNLSTGWQLGAELPRPAGPGPRPRPGRRPGHSRGPGRAGRGRARVRAARRTGHAEAAVRRGRGATANVGQARRYGARPARDGVRLRTARRARAR